MAGLVSDWGLHRESREKLLVWLNLDIFKRFTQLLYRYEINSMCPWLLVLPSAC